MVNTIFIVTSDVIHLYNYSNLFGVFLQKNMLTVRITHGIKVCAYFFVLFFFISNKRYSI